MIVNASIQVVPLTKTEEAFPVIDKVIALIQKSGLKYSVGAFETTVEGEYETVQQLQRQVTDYCYSHKEFQFLVYTKLHLWGAQNILIETKTSKFRNDSDFNL